jgi:hypothetical protein
MLHAISFQFLLTNSGSTIKAVGQLGNGKTPELLTLDVQLNHTALLIKKNLLPIISATFCNKFIEKQNGSKAFQRETHFPNPKNPET